MSKYVVRGSVITVGADLDIDVRERLPVATYSVGLDPQTGYFLQIIKDFQNPSKIYGKANNHAERFLNTFSQRSATTGALLVGEKGSGKSLTMKRTSQLGLEAGIPTIVVSAPFHGEAFNKFIQSISDPCVLCFDEFEKVYDEQQQEALLTLLDGTFNSKKLVILTCNDKYRVDKHMTNRPGRLFYSINYGGVDEAFIREYCAENLEKDQAGKVENIVRLASLFSKFNFDMMKALVEEINRYKETVQEAISILNINVESTAQNVYDLAVTDQDGRELSKNDYYPAQIRDVIYQDQLVVTVYSGKPDEDGDRDENVIYMSANSQAAKLSSDLKQLTIISDGYTFIWSKHEVKDRDYSHYYM